MKKVVVLGHFAFGMDKANGQTIKTKIVAQELIRVFGADQVDCKDTMGRWKFLLRLPCLLFQMVRNYHHIVVLPAYKGVRVIVPMLALLNIFYHRKLHYVVIGGWLPNYVRKYPLLRYASRHFDNIYVETLLMKRKMDELHFSNVKVMPNCKPLKIVRKEDLKSNTQEPLKLCTFSRVMKEKGIEEAAIAVAEVNFTLGRDAFHLDIYGMIEPWQEKWFNKLMQQQPKTIQYKGIVNFDESSTVLQQYFALLFPTFYAGEGFPGTLIDALAAGLPTIASDCLANPELIDEGSTGLLFPMLDRKAFKDILLKVADNPAIIDQMRVNCVTKASNYLPERVLDILIQDIKA